MTAVKTVENQSVVRLQKICKIAMKNEQNKSKKTFEKCLTEWVTCCIVSKCAEQLSRCKHVGV